MEMPPFGEEERLECFPPPPKPFEARLKVFLLASLLLGLLPREAEPAVVVLLICVWRAWLFFLNIFCGFWAVDGC